MRAEAQSSILHFFAPLVNSSTSFAHKAAKDAARRTFGKEKTPMRDTTRPPKLLPGPSFPDKTRGGRLSAPASISLHARMLRKQRRYDSTFSSSRSSAGAEASASSASGMKGSNSGSPFWDSSTMPVSTSTYW